MSPTSSPSLQDCAVALRALGGCLDLGADPQAWTAHLASCVKDLVRARIVVATQMTGLDKTAKFATLCGTKVGWEDAGTDHEKWAAYVRSVPLSRKPEFPRLAAIAQQGSVARSDIWNDQQWDRSEVYQDGHRPAGVDDWMISVIRFGPVASTLYCHRAVGDKPFSQRDRKLLELVHFELRPRLGTRLMLANRPTADQLSPRRREVLNLLLAGMTEKEIAQDLHRSPATVHEHILAIYQHFGVRSRGELMAHFVGAGTPVAV
jgi:DNA-binding CsgD family transcriptional regulator